MCGCMAPVQSSLQLGGTFKAPCYIHTHTLSLTQKYPDFEVTLDAGPVNRYCEHAIFYNHTDKSKLTPRPRVLLEIFHSGTIAGIDKDKVKRMVQDTLDPNDCC